MEKLAYSVNESAEVLGIGRTLLFELIREGRIPSVKLGHRRLIPRSDLEEFVQSLQREAA